MTRFATVLLAALLLPLQGYCADVVPLETTPAPAATTLTCTAPLELFCTPEGCSCVTIGTPPQACQVSIVYPAGVPAQAEVGPLPTGCDRAAAEIAVASALAKLLQAP